MSERWWPAREYWPEFPYDTDPGTLKDCTPKGYRYGTEEALALLILDSIVVPLNGDDHGVCVMAECSDLFFWGTADCEPLPLIGFGGQDEVDFWELYDAYRLRGHAGVDEWCCLRRKMRPQEPVERQMRETGTWTAALEALPERKIEGSGWVKGITHWRPLPAPPKEGE